MHEEGDQAEDALRITESSPNGVFPSGLYEKKLSFQLPVVFSAQVGCDFALLQGFDFICRHFWTSQFRGGVLLAYGRWRPGLLPDFYDAQQMMIWSKC